MNIVSKTLDHEDDPYKRLAMAIVLRAIQDYKIACRAKARGGYTRWYKECEAFFKSDYARLLTDMELPDIAKKIRKRMGVDE